MQVKYKCVEDDIIQFECTDIDGKVYGVGDIVVDKKIQDTIVIDMETYDEIEDSELFKRIVTARSIFICDDYYTQEVLQEMLK
jgi:hypothetical protein